MNEEPLIVIKKSSAKKVLLDIFSFIISLNLKFDSYAEAFWVKLLGKEPRLLILVQHKFIRPVFTNILLGFIGVLFGGLISQVLLIFVFSNTVALLVGQMDWVKKLKKT